MDRYDHRRAWSAERAITSPDGLPTNEVTIRGMIWLAGSALMSLAAGHAREETVDRLLAAAGAALPPGDAAYFFLWLDRWAR